MVQKLEIFIKKFQRVQILFLPTVRSLISVPIFSNRPHSGCYWVSAPPGLEDVALVLSHIFENYVHLFLSLFPKSEIITKLKPELTETRQGKVLFKTASPETEIVKLHSVEKLYSLVYTRCFFFFLLLFLLLLLLRLRVLLLLVLIVLSVL